MMAEGLVTPIFLYYQMFMHFLTPTRFLIIDWVLVETPAETLQRYAGNLPLPAG